MTSLARASERCRIETCDPRSDDRRRIVEVAPGAVTIRRAVGGVSMTIRLSSRAYRGVALRIGALEGGRFHYEVRLAHRDPDLSVVLGAGDDLAAMEAQWRDWVAWLRLPALAGRSEAADSPVNLSRAALARRTPIARRRRAATGSRRPRCLKRRAFAPQPGGDPVDRDPVVLFYGWKDDR